MQRVQQPIGMPDIWRRDSVRFGESCGVALNQQDDCDLTLSEFAFDRGGRLPKHSHELAFFSLILDGNFIEHQRKGSTVLEPLTTIFQPSGLECQDEIGSNGMRVFSIEMRDHWWERLRECGALSQSTIKAQGSELTWLAMRLYREFHNRDRWSKLAIEGLVLEMLSVAARSHERQDKRPPSWLPRVLDLLHTSFQQHLTVAAIAAEVGVHPIYLTRVFRRFHRQSIAEYIHKLRVQFALQEMGNVDRCLADIATAAGFSDQSHFTRVFKDLMGTPPGAFRTNLYAERSPTRGKSGTSGRDKVLNKPLDESLT